MKITLNGQCLEVPEGTTLADLIQTRGVNVTGLIAALGDQVVRQEQWGGTSLRDGVTVELVALVGGG